ncbi:MAG: flagellar export protein FliJ [candidate division Zixibacteria bacterium 4484_95]|nr:MAG: flagellar export protein FliJ [candidate division Zixibacteria bacterium 4484_95]
MKKFNFRLEKIKRYKEQLEQDKKRKLATQQIRCQKEKNKLASLTSKHDKYFSLYGVRKPGRININQLILSKRYIDKLSGDMKNQAKIVSSAQKNVAGAQKALLEASREKKKYEKLKKRKLQSYTEESNRLENKELDEFSSRRDKVKFGDVQHF